MRAKVLAPLCLSAAILTTVSPVHGATLSFEALLPGTTVPFSLTDDGVTGSFSSPDGPVFIVLPTFPGLSMLTGNILFDADTPIHPLDIVFSQPQNGIAFSFALNGGPSSTIELQFFAGAVSLGTISAFGAMPVLPPFFPQGSINHTSATPFDRVRITPTVPDFAIDDVTVSTTTAVPEPSSLLLLGLGLAGFALRARRTRSS